MPGIRAQLQGACTSWTKFESSQTTSDGPQPEFEAASKDVVYLQALLFNEP